jgi:hypothetical protein
VPCSTSKDKFGRQQEVFPKNPRGSRAVFGQLNAVLDANGAEKMLKSPISFFCVFFEHFADLAYLGVSKGRCGKRSTKLNKYRKNLCAKNPCPPSQARVT